MFVKVLQGALVPFFGTTLGALFSLLGNSNNDGKFRSVMSGFASGVMVASSVWSLLIPSVEYSEKLDRFSFLPAVSGLFLGVAFMILSDKTLEGILTKEGIDKKRNMMFFAVTLHNVPEGMAIGAAYAAAVISGLESDYVAAFLLSFGIAVQNIPEGAIVSLLYKNEKGNFKGVTYGVISGVVEPLAVFMTVVMSTFLVPVLPVFLSFAAGAMLYVVMKELSTDFSGDEHSDKGMLSFVLGFSVMMSLDVAL